MDMTHKNSIQMYGIISLILTQRPDFSPEYFGFNRYIQEEGW